MERWRKWKFCLGELQSFNAFVMLKATFSKHYQSNQHDTISMTNLKYDTTEMTEATKEDCIGCLLKNCCLMGKKRNF